MRLIYAFLAVRMLQLARFDLARSGNALPER